MKAISESLEVNDGYELDEALRAAGYLGEGNDMGV
jgi:hypothetical protein